jgi:hypothetical protein
MFICPWTESIVKYRRGHKRFRSGDVITITHTDRLPTLCTVISLTDTRTSGNTCNGIEYRYNRAHLVFNTSSGLKQTNEQLVIDEFTMAVDTDVIHHGGDADDCSWSHQSTVDRGTAGIVTVRCFH